MSPELRVFIDSLTGAATKKPPYQGKPPCSMLREVARKIGVIFGMIADVLSALGPYACELRSIQTVKEAMAECRARRDAIGHHGLA